MGEKEYLRSIRPGQDRIRYYHLTEGKRVIKFLVQYETFIEGKWREIVRYDSAHGHPHKDVLHPDGSQDKEYFQGWSNAEVLNLRAGRHSEKVDRISASIHKGDG